MLNFVCSINSFSCTCTSTRTLNMYIKIFGKKMSEEEKKLSEISSFLSLENPDQSYEDLEKYLNECPDFYQILLTFLISPDFSSQIRFSALSILNTYFKFFVQNYEESEDAIISTILTNSLDLFHDVVLQQNLPAVLVNFANINSDITQSLYELVGSLYADEATIRGAILLLQELTVYNDMTPDESLFEPLVTLINNPDYVEDTLKLGVQIVKYNNSAINHALLEQIFASYESYNEKCIEYSAEMCAEVYLNEQDETCCEFLSQALMTDSETLSYNILSYIYDDACAYQPQERLITALVSKIEKPDDNPLEYGICSMAQEILCSIGNSSWPVLEPMLNELIEQIEDDGFKLRALYPILALSEKNTEYLPYIEEQLEGEHKADAIADLVPLAKSNVSLVNDFIDIVIPFLNDEDKYTMRIAFFSLENFINGQFEATPERFEALIEVFTAFREEVFSDRMSHDSEILQLFSSLIYYLDIFISCMESFDLAAYSEFFSEIMSYIQEDSENALYFNNSISLIASIIRKSTVDFCDEFISIGERALNLLNSDDEDLVYNTSKIIDSLVLTYTEPFSQVPYFLSVVMTICKKLHQFKDTDKKDLLVELWTTLKDILLGYSELPTEIYEFAIELTKIQYCTPNYEVSRKIAQALLPLLPNFDNDFLILLYTRSQIITNFSEPYPLSHVPIQTLLTRIQPILTERGINIQELNS